MPKALRSRLVLIRLAPAAAGLLLLLIVRWAGGSPGAWSWALLGAAIALLTVGLASLAARFGPRRADGRAPSAAAAGADGVARDVATGSSRDGEADEARAERSRLEAVLEHSADGVLAIDDEDEVSFINPAACRLLEIGDRGRALGRSFVAVVRDHEVAAVLQRARAAGAQVAEVVQLGALRRPVEAIFLPLDGAGSWRFLGLLHDLTDVRRIEGHRRDFVSNVSHELRTPLASIKAVVQVLADGDLDDPEQTREFLRAVDHEVDRLSQLVEEMLELSRIESGIVPFRFAPVDAEELCAEAVRRLAVQAERGGVALTSTAGEHLRPLRADRERLLRALLNLAHNAIKFTPAGGEVEVYARDAGDRAAIGVRDSGAGIPREDVGRIFERFYKVDRARTSQGTGLGLAIVKHTVQAHNGTIEVESAPGRGSDFRMLLPYA